MLGQLKQEEHLSYQTIKVDTRDGLCVVTQDRPERLNARSSQMYAEMIAAFEAADADAEVCALLLASSGDAFCSGMDFKNEYQHAYTVLPEDSEHVAAIKAEFPADDPMTAVVGLAKRFVQAFIRFEKPLIAAVNGAAVGEGFSSILHCDLVYATPNAYFWAPFARAGAAPEFCATVLAPRRLGPTLANAALYFGRKIDVHEAHGAGFVLEILERENFLDEVEKRLQEGLALAGPPELRASTLRSFRALVYSDEERERLYLQADREFDLVQQRVRSGETDLVRQYYASQLPS